VEAALQWLARHQEPDGSWDLNDYEVTQYGYNGKNIRIGGTGLALLAFLGAGYTEKSGKFADNVKRAEQWLLSQQKPSGGIFEGPESDSNKSMGYNHSIAGLALAEAYRMAGDPRLGDAAQRAVDFSIKTMQSPYSGWRYYPKEAADVSATGWFVMQLKSAKVAGLRVDGAAFQGAQTYIDKHTDKDGRTTYGADGHRSPTPAMTSVGMVCRQFMGTPNTDPALLGGASYLLTTLPDWQKANVKIAGTGQAIGDKGFYYWYYGTLAMFQMGGDKWTKWNEALKPTLINSQCKGGPMDGSKADKDGSWDPSGWIDFYGGRVYTTAVGALCLEVYYRYLPMYTK
jgi:hypothetical protein